MTTVHIIQTTDDGIPDEPQVFRREADALVAFRKVYDDGLWMDRDGEAADRDGLSDLGYLSDADGSREVRWYVVELED